MIWHTAHFNKIAKMLREKREVIMANKGPRGFRQRELQIPLLNELTLEFAEYFKEQNGEFDEQRFIEACGFGVSRSH